MSPSPVASIPVRLVFGIGVLAIAPAATIAAPAAQAQAPVQTPTPAPASASLDAILKDVARYDGGIDSGAAWTLRNYVFARQDEPAPRAECETKLLAFMKSAQTPVAKMAAARALRVIAGDSAVPALQALLADDRSADAALYAFQGIPGPAADKAIVQSVSTSIGVTKTGVIAALGERRAGSALPVLTPLLQQPAFASAVAIALGRVGGDAAAAALVTTLAGASGELKLVTASAILAAADMATAAQNTVAAGRLYESVAADTTLPAPLRKAAAIGTISSAAHEAPALLLRLLTGADADLREAAVTKIPGVFTTDTITQVSALFPTLPEDTAIQVLAALANYPADRVGTAVLSRLGSESEPERLAAIKALPSVGGPAAVRPLAERAAVARGAEQTAARTALASLKGRAVDDEIVTQLQTKPTDAVSAELTLALGERRNYAAKPMIAAALTSESAAIRTAAHRALRIIGTPSDMTLVINALLATRNATDRTEAERTVVALGQKIASLDGRSRLVRARLETETVAESSARLFALLGTMGDPAARLDMETTAESRVRLIALLGMMGDPAALPVLRSALKDQDANVVDAAVRAMAAWPSSAAREDLIALARDLRNETHRLLAIQGLIRTIGLDTYRDPPSLVADLRLTAGFAWRAEEQRLVLGVLGRFPCVEALDLARGFLQDTGLNKEAQATIDRIMPRLPKEIRK